MIKSQLEKQQGFMHNQMSMKQIEADPTPPSKKNKKTVPGSTSYL